MDMGFLQKERILPGAHKIGAGISGPRIADTNFTDTRIFLILWSEIQNDIAEADADFIPVPGQLELHGRCRYGVLLSPCFCALVCCRSNCGDGGIRVTLQMQRQI